MRRPVIFIGTSWPSDNELYDFLIHNSLKVFKNVYLQLKTYHSFLTFKFSPLQHTSTFWNFGLYIKGNGEIRERLSVLMFVKHNVLLTIDYKCVPFLQNFQEYKNWKFYLSPVKLIGWVATNLMIFPTIW